MFFILWPVARAFSYVQQCMEMSRSSLVYECSPPLRLSCPL
jgi:hypothetical protein